ncbi:MAG: acyl-CoA/acyl-ACP dehydrogenase [Caldilineaceae bacterium]|nr:acyl-CoA/acyl-ACP dehydrogenase [Caldilineaceae bacterium]
MYIPRTERQQAFIAMADELAPRFAARAAEHDRDGSFPHENFAEIRAAGLPGLVIPTAYGGQGATLLETLMTMEALARGDGSTALSLTMHMQTMGSALEGDSWPEPLLEKLCREIVTEGALINSCATEPELGSPSHGGRPKTTATPLDVVGDSIKTWRINGRKSFASMSPTLDYYIIPAALEDGSEEVARFVIPSSDRIEIIPTWDSMGMRATGSHDIVLHDVTASTDNITSRSNSTRFTQGGKVNAWFMLVIGGVYLGVAEAALQTAADYANQRVPTALGKPIATLPAIQRQLGQADILIHQAQVMLYNAAACWDKAPAERIKLGPMVMAAKVVATNNAIAAVDHCLRAVGGAGMTRSLPLERYYRDVRGGLLHPVNDEQALILFGQGVL